MEPVRKLIRRNQENFPVASLLLPWAYRGKIMALYRFARHADDIADDPSMDAIEKKILLKIVDEALEQKADAVVPEWARAYYLLVQAGTCDAAYGRALLSAFLQDVTCKRYVRWQDLMDYCNRSAAPVGRAVLEIAGETQADLQASDALCNALQVLNHVQDCGEDYRLRDRVYLPLNWMQDEEIKPEVLGAEESITGLRRVIDRVLDHTQALLKTAEALPYSIKGWQMRLEVRYILCLAQRLTEKLRREDPLQGKVRLTWREKLDCFGQALKGRRS